MEDTNFNENIKSKVKKTSVFVSDKSWEDEDFKIPENIRRGIIEELKWDKPSKI